METTIKCLLCEKELKAIGASHLKACSNISTQEYKNRFPNAPFMAEATTRKFSKVGASNNNWCGGTSKSAGECTICSKILDRRNKSGYCNSHRPRSGEDNPFYKKKHSNETRKQMEVSASNRDNSTRYVIPHTKEIIDKREKSKKERWNNLSTEEQYSQIKNFIGAGSKLKKDTKIELIIKEVLDNVGFVEGVNYRRNIGIAHYNVDFIINDHCIVECYGDYWHKNPKFFGKEGETKREKDKIKEQFLNEKGYRFIYFWEVDIHNSLADVTTKLLKFIRG